MLFMVSKFFIISTGSSKCTAVNLKDISNTYTMKKVSVIYMQSNKIHKVFLMSEFYSALILARHVSDLTSPKL